MFRHPYWYLTLFPSYLLLPSLIDPPNFLTPCYSLLSCSPIPKPLRQWSLLTFYSITCTHMGRFGVRGLRGGESTCDTSIHLPANVMILFFFTYIPHLHYFITRWRPFRFFPFMAITNRMSINMTEQVYGEWSVLWVYIKKWYTWLIWEISTLISRGTEAVCSSTNIESGFPFPYIPSYWLFYFLLYYNTHTHIIYVVIFLNGCFIDLSNSAWGRRKFWFAFP